MTPSGEGWTAGLMAGLGAAVATGLLSVLKQRWKRQETREHGDATVEIARIGAVDQFQQRLMERVHELEQRAPELSEPIAKLLEATGNLMIAKSVLLSVAESLTIAKVIMLVEDNQSDVELTQRVLRRSRIVNQLIVAADGAAALSYLSGAGRIALPALILLDLGLPTMTGQDVLRRIRGDARLRKIPVVVLTSAPTTADQADMEELGINAYITKPVDFAQFASVMEHLGRFWLVVEDAPPATMIVLKSA